MRIGCSGLRVRYPTSDSDALDDVTLDVSSGELLAVLGPSGSGKSTLLLALAGLVDPSSGEVAADGVSLGELKDLTAFRRRLGVVFQFPESQLFGATVREEVAFGPQQQGLSQADAETRVRAALSEAGLPEETLERSPFTLSGGEQRRVALADALAMDPALLLLDEPTAGLDAAGRDSFVGSIRRSVDGGRGALVVSHDPAVVLPIADRAAVLTNGAIAWLGPASELRADRTLAASMGIALGIEDDVADRLRERGWHLPQRRWTPEGLAAAIAEARP